MYWGDFNLAANVDGKFTSRRFSSGAPFTLAGSPALACYPDNSTTEITAGITLSVDHDSRTGMNHVRIAATGANGYAAGTTYNVVLTSGTVDGVSVVGEVVGCFSVERVPKVNTVQLDGITEAIAYLVETCWDGEFTGTPTTTGGTLLNYDVAGLRDDFIVGWRIYVVTTGSHAIVTGYNGTTGELTWAPAMDVAPEATDRVFLTPTASTAFAVGHRTGNLSGSVGNVTAGVTLANDAITPAKIQDAAFTAAKFASGAFDAVWSVATRVLTAFGFTPSLHADYDAAKTAASQTSVDDLPADTVDALYTEAGTRFLPVDAHKQNFDVAGSTLTAYEPDGTTPAYTKTVTTDPDAEPITGAS